MSAPNLIAFYSPLSADPVLAARSIHTRGVYQSGRNEKDGPCDWNDDTDAPDWQASESGSDWHSSESGSDWHSSESGSDWHSSESGADWKTDKDCE